MLVPPRHELAQGGRTGAHRVIRRSNRVDHGQRVGEALIVEERAGKKLSIVSAACTKEALHWIGHPASSSKKLL